MKLLYIPCPLGETAPQIAKIALEKKLAFCANILTPMTSMYVWDSKIQSESEVGLILKTFASMETSLLELVKTIHPYSVPAIVSIAFESLNAEYTEWAKSATLPEN